MPANSFYEVSKVKPSRRASAYRGYLKRNKYAQDTLENRISANVGLSEDDVNDLVVLLTNGCRRRNTNLVRHALTYMENDYSYAIFSRLVKHPEHGWSYSAAQCYPSEIRYVRELLIKHA